MINKYIRVTNNITEADLEEISQHGYHFQGWAATEGYEWSSNLVVPSNEDLNKLYLPTFPQETHFEYDRDSISLSEDEIIRNIELAPPPEPIDLQAPWLVEKGSLELCQKQISEGTPQLEWKAVPVHECHPMSTRTLHRRFTSLKIENLESEVLSFVNKYGMLGRTATLRSLPGQPPGITEGESLYRWRKEIERMGVLLAIWDLIRMSEVGKLGQVIVRRGINHVEVKLKWRCENGNYEIQEWEGNRKDNSFGYIHEIIENKASHKYKRWDIIEPAKDYVGKNINFYMFGTHSKLCRSGEREWEVVYVPGTLLGALWLLFMLEVNGKIKTSRCRYCGAWFNFERSSRTYCNGNCRRLAFYHKRNKNRRR